MTFEEKMKEVSIYNRLGGDAAFEAAVEHFFTRTYILKDDELMPFFEGVDMDRLRIDQRRIVKLVLTGYLTYVDLPDLIMEKLESRFEMGMSERPFDLLTRYLVSTLEALEVEDPLIEECIAVTAPLRDVFERGASDAAYFAIIEKKA